MSEESPEQTSENASHKRHNPYVDAEAQFQESPDRFSRGNKLEGVYVDRSETMENGSLPTPSLKPMDAKRGRNIHLSLSFAVFLGVLYAFTSAPAGFQHITQLAASIGSFYPPAVADGQWWRWITANLIHANPGHLFNNVFGIIVFGNLMEPVVGAPRLFLLYVISAISGLAFSYVFLPTTPTLGASCIDFGLVGAYFTLVLALRYRYSRETFSEELRGAFFFVLIFVLWNWLEMATVNLWGHVGGLLGGVVFALCLLASRPKSLPEG